MTSTVTRVPVGQLVEDLSLYPRLQIDDVYVGRLAEALRAGAVLPPLVADARTSRLVDGFHRRRAAVLVWGPETEVDVVFREYADDAELFVDALRRNAAHGKMLTAADHTKALLRAQELGIEPKIVADALAVRVEVLLERIERRVAQGTAEPAVVLKPALRHLAGERLTMAQEQVNRHAGGHQIGYYVRVLTELLEVGAVNLENPSIVERLRRLHEVLGRVLAVVAERERDSERAA